MPTRLFFSTEAFDVAVARAICSRCRVRAECLDEALRLEIGPWRFGVRAGLTPGERRALTGGR
jgi:hypothetical protein